MNPIKPPTTIGDCWRLTLNIFAEVRGEKAKRNPTFIFMMKENGDMCRALLLPKNFS